MSGLFGFKLFPNFRQEKSCILGFIPQLNIQDYIKNRQLNTTESSPNPLTYLVKTCYTKYVNLIVTIVLFNFQVGNMMNEELQDPEDDLDKLYKQYKTGRRTLETRSIKC